MEIDRDWEEKRSRRRVGREGSERSRSPHQEIDVSSRNKHAVSSSNSRCRRQDGFERVRGRPKGHNRTPLSREEQRARNAYYERERREKLAEGWDLLRAAMDSEEPQNKLLEDAVPFIKYMEQQMRGFEEARDFLRSNNIALRAKFAELNAIGTENMVVEIQDESLPQGVVEQEDDDSGVHSAGAGVNSPNPSLTSPEHQVPISNPQEPLNHQNPRPVLKATTSNPMIPCPNPVVLLPDPQLPSPERCQPSSHTSTSSSSSPSPDPRLLLPDADIDDIMDFDTIEPPEEAQLRILESHYYEVPKVVTPTYPNLHPWQEVRPPTGLAKLDFPVIPDTPPTPPSFSYYEFLSDEDKWKLEEFKSLLLT